jgi:TPP-dependent pyruvate/acetoin dehydrogenase alpha subunit
MWTEIRNGSGPQLLEWLLIVLEAIQWARTLPKADEVHQWKRSGANRNYRKYLIKTKIATEEELNEQITCNQKYRNFELRNHHRTRLQKSCLRIFCWNLGG